MEYRRSYERELKHGKKLDWPVIKRLFGYLMPYKSLMYTAILLLIISKGIEAYVPAYLGSVAQGILSGYSLGPQEKAGLLAAIFRQCVLIGFLLILAYILDNGTIYLKNWIGQRGIFSLRNEVYQHIQRMPVDFYNKTAVGTLMTRTIHDVDQINQLFAESIVPLIGSIMLFFCVCVGIAIVDWRAALVLFSILPFVFWLTNHFRHNQRRCYDLIRGIVSAMNAFVQEHLMGASTIRSFGLQEEEKKHFEEINMDHRNANVETIHYFAFFFAGIDLLQSLSLISVFIVLVSFSRPLEGFEAGTYFTFSLYVLMLFRPLADLAERYNLLQSAMAAADRIFKVLDGTPESFEGGGEELNEIEKIEFDDVWFAYKSENWVLKGLTFTIEKGESFALVGMTGAGKTTVLNLLLRFYQVQRGEIRINGKNIDRFSLGSLRRQFSVVLQDPEIFSGTIADNISLRNPEITPQRIETVVTYVHLAPFLDSLKDGLSHRLTERGKSLSAGQRQLISLARAVAHDRSAFILDEATANIDSGTEKIIQDVLKKVIHDKTSIVIAHRFSTIKDVDKIIVLHAGQAKEIGTHRELLEKKGIYEKLLRLQFMDER